MSLLFAGAGLAQEHTEASDSPRLPEEMEETAAEDTTARRAPRGATRSPRLWSGDVSLSGIYDSNASRNEDELDAQGIVAGVAGSYQNRPSRPTLQLRYATAVHAYTEIERWDRVSHSFRAAYNLRLTPNWDLETIGYASLGVITTEFRLANQYTLIPRLEYAPNRRHRLQLYGAYRYKQYRDEGRTDAISPYAGIHYRYRWGSWHYGDAAFRFESNHAELSHRRFRRMTLSVDYTRPLGRSDRLRLELIYRSERYLERWVETDRGEVLRQDRRWTPVLYWIHDLSRDMRVYVDYRFLVRLSNDARREFNAHRIAVTLRHFW